MYCILCGCMYAVMNVFHLDGLCDDCFDKLQQSNSWEEFNGSGGSDD